MEQEMPVVQEITPVKIVKIELIEKSLGQVESQDLSWVIEPFPHPKWIEFFDEEWARIIAGSKGPAKFYGNAIRITVHDKLYPFEDQVRFVENCVAGANEKVKIYNAQLKERQKRAGEIKAEREKVGGEASKKLLEKVQEYNKKLEE